MKRVIVTPSTCRDTDPWHSRLRAIYYAWDYSQARCPS